MMKERPESLDSLTPRQKIHLDALLIAEKRAQERASIKQQQIKESYGSSDFLLTDKQKQARDILESPATHILLYGGSRSGKTFEIIENIVKRALSAPLSRHTILRFRFNHCKASIIFDTFPKVMQTCYSEVEYELNRSDWYVLLPNDSEVWFGGLDEKDRTEKILGLEYVTIFLNECSQIPFPSRNLALTRLAQKCVTYDNRELPLKMFYDENPPSKNHWTHRLFIEHRDPDSKQPVSGSNYACLQMNPEDNLENLPSDYMEELEALPVRARKRFLKGEFADITKNALWTEEIIEKWRSLDSDLPDMSRVVVSVDPSGADDEDNTENDEIGIMVGGLGTDGNGYLLEDLTLKAGPARWGKVATSAYDRHEADRVVGEVNYGGAMVKYVVQTARPNTPFKMVRASRGKVVRAEPISALHETGKIRLVGYFPELEEELCGFLTTGYIGEDSPNRADAFIWLMSELFPGMTKHMADDPKPRKRAPRITGRNAWMR